VLDSTKFAGISYYAIGLSLYLATALCAVVSLWKSEQTLENLMLFAGWIYLAFFLFPTEIHGRFLYYGVVLLALPATRNKMLLGAYVTLSVILYLNVKFSMERFAPGMYVIPESMSNTHRVLSAIALGAGVVFFVENHARASCARLRQSFAAEFPGVRQVS
jgi:hypothetical protein